MHYVLALVMRKFLFNKLVRDEIVPGIIKNGAKPQYRQLDDKEFKKELVKKLQEEVDEFYLQPDDDVTELIADVQEVLDTLMSVHNISKEEITKKQEEKRTRRGGFNKRYFIEFVECNDDYPWIKYYEENPQKYPEIKS